MSTAQNAKNAGNPAALLGRYDIVKTALQWIEVKKYDEDYRKLSQADLITKALDDVASNVATPEAIEELRKKNKEREAKKEEAASSENAKE